MNPSTRAARMEAALRATFEPTLLTITDDSEHHAGHRAMKGIAAAETHFTIAMTSAAFGGLSRVARSRLVQTSLAKEFSLGLHALSLTLLAP